MLGLVVILSVIVAFFGVTFGQQATGEPYYVDDDKSIDNHKEDLVTALKSEPSSDGKYEIYFVVAEGSNTAGNSLNEVKLTFEKDSVDLSNVDQYNEITAGFDTNGDGTIDTNIDGDINSLSTSNNGRTVTIGFTGNYNMNEGDNLIVQVSDGANPSSGTYNATVGVNGDVTKEGQIKIE